MLFNSLDFLLFFPIVVFAYWILPDRFRNPMLLMASYYFYMNWEPVYALLILFSSVTTWGCGLLIQKRRSSRYLTACILINIAILFFYKYFDFFGQSISAILNTFGLSISVPHFDLLLPVGISFYTFQAIGYIVDVYRKDIKAEKSFLTYALFVSFFPQLVAGPIERAKNLLPQFHTRHFFNGDNMIAGVRMMLWGYFMKLCIADTVAPYVNAVFDNVSLHTGESIWLASFFFTFQIFCDFAGYSLIAIGTAKCLNFNLMQNFRQPYLAKNIKEFWRRWHISLSSWLTDYIFIPLGGSRNGELKRHRNLFLTFLISGLWHGANWTFVLWGLYHSFLQSLLIVKSRIKVPFSFHRFISRVLSILVTFIAAIFGWVLFRANNIHDALSAWKKMLNPSGPLFNGEGKPSIVLPLILIGVLMLREIANELNLRLKVSPNTQFVLSGIAGGFLIVVILLCAGFDGGQFIYFQF